MTYDVVYGNTLTRRVLIGTSTDKPASGSATELYIETDTDTVYRGTGTGWKEVGRTVGFGEIYSYNNSTPQSIPAGSTFTKVTAWNANGNSLNTTPDYVNGKITANKSGTWAVLAAFTILSGTNAVIFDFAAHLNGVRQDNLHLRRKMATTSDVGNMVLHGLVSGVNAGDEIDVRVIHDNGSAVDLTVQYANFSVLYVGG